MQCCQPQALASHPEDTVSTSGATRLGVLDEGLLLRADSASKSCLEHTPSAKLSP